MMIVDSFNYSQLTVGVGNERSFVMKGMARDEWVEVQVDGNELVYAEQLLGRSVPENKKVFTFAGDDARTILLNW